MVNPVNKWKFIGGSLCLDFANSVGGRTPIAKKFSAGYNVLSDKLKNFNDLIDWGKNVRAITKTEAGELTKLSTKDSKAAAGIFQRALNLRESIFKILCCIAEGAKPGKEDIDILNFEFNTANENQSLIYRSNKFEWVYANQTAGMDNINWKVAGSSVELLTSDLLRHVKICPGENCGWLFLDITKNKSRHWCDMRDCGNIAKVRRFRQKQR